MGNVIDIAPLETPVELDVEFELGTIIQGGTGDGILGVFFNDVEQEIDENKYVHINEEDPTVPGWAKSQSKPSYTADEIDAVDVNDQMTFGEIDNMFNAVFN